MADKSDDNTSRGRFRAFYEWLTGATPSPHSSSGVANVREGLPSRIGHYAIARKLGEGGMGVVYEARDERLERTVALKTMSALADDETARKRFWREARAAASVNHPNVCQIYEIGEDAGELFIAMELLEGEALAERLQRGPLNVSRNGADRPRHAGRALGAARPRHRPPRSQAVERVPHATRRQAARLRPGAARAGAVDQLGDGPDAHRAGHGHAALHGARTDSGRRRRRAQRSVRGGRHPVRDARGAPGVRRPHGRRGPARHAQRTAAGAQRLACRGRRGPRDPPGAGQAAGGTAGVSRRDGRGAARRARCGRR